MRLQNKGILYCVAVPIGNLADLTERARDTLKKVNVIAAEDTRILKKFLTDSKIKTEAKFISYYDAKEAEKAGEILAQLVEGLSVAIVSDAGTPNIYDPGYRILTLAYENEIDVVPIPGASSLTAALSVCPIPGLNFCFFGFPPAQSSARLKLFNEIKFDGRIVFFESPHRLIDHLSDAKSCWGGDKKLFIARELTKKFEEKSVKSIDEWLTYFKSTAPKGEFVLIYERQSHSLQSQEDLDQWLQDKISQGISSREILKEAQNRFNLNRKDIYSKITKLKESK